MTADDEQRVLHCETTLQTGMLFPSIALFYPLT